MGLTPKEIQAEIEKRLEAEAEKRGKDLADKIRPILYSNLDRGRIEAYIGGDISRLGEYVERVAEGHRKLSVSIHEIQTTRTSKVWTSLFERMQNWAFNFLVRKGFTANASTQEIAAECAADAASTLLKAHFPYDTEFDPWAHVIVQNACRKFMRAGTKKSVIPEESLLSLDENLRSLDDPPLDNRDPHESMEMELLDAIARLSDARKEVIRLIYFDELPPAEVAKKMGKTVGAVYSLQFNALEELRKILREIRNNLND